MGSLGDVRDLVAQSAAARDGLDGLVNNAAALYVRGAQRDGRGCSSFATSPVQPVW